MDALDPNVKTTFAVDLYTNDECIESLYNGLTESGILVVQLGEANSVFSPADEVGQYENRAIMMEKLEEVGFKSMHVYGEVRT